MKINNFNEYVIESGFLRDVQEYISTISQPQNSQNIILLKDITDRVLKHLTVIQESDVPDDIKKLLPQEKIKPFHPQAHIQVLSELMSDTQVDTSQYHSRLTKELTDLRSELSGNQSELKKLYDVLFPFYEKESKVSEKAVISFIFKDISTISNFKNFAKILVRWNRTLYLYHQLVSSKIPKDIELVNIQNGSLDVILNIDIDIAMNFTDIVKYGLIAFNGYLLYKMRVHEIVETYFGNKKLIDSEKERESELLENIGGTIKNKLLEQHNSFKKKDKDISGESIDKKIDEVSKVLSEHIVKGNDIKFLVHFDDSDETFKESRKLIDETKKASIDARNRLKKLALEDKKLLIERYILGTDDTNDT
jgi:hypothetical protein